LARIVGPYAVAIRLIGVYDLYIEILDRKSTRL